MLKAPKSQNPSNNQHFLWLCPGKTQHKFLSMLTSTCKSTTAHHKVTSRVGVSCIRHPPMAQSANSTIRQWPNLPMAQSANGTICQWHNLPMAQYAKWHNLPMAQYANGTICQMAPYAKWHNL